LYEIDHIVKVAAVIDPSVSKLSELYDGIKVVLQKIRFKNGVGFWRIRTRRSISGSHDANRAASGNQARQKCGVKEKESVFPAFNNAGNLGDAPLSQDWGLHRHIAEATKRTGLGDRREAGGKSPLGPQKPNLFKPS
jgi:hypothetical protein